MSEEARQVVRLDVVPAAHPLDLQATAAASPPSPNGQGGIKGRQGRGATESDGGSCRHPGLTTQLRS